MNTILIIEDDDTLRMGISQVLKKNQFNPNCIKDTPQNKQQIARMAKLCGHDSLPLLDVLLEKSCVTL